MSYRALAPEYNGPLEPFLKPMKGHLVVHVVEGEALYPKDSFSGKSDPYVKVGHGSTKKTKVVKKNNMHPVWDEKLEWKDITIQPGHQLKFEVFDWDLIGKNDRMGLCRLATNSILSNEHLDRWMVLVPRKRKEKARGRLHIKVTFLTKDRPLPPPPPAPAPRYECAEPLFMAPPPPPVVVVEAPEQADEEEEVQTRSAPEPIPPPLPPASLQIWRYENGGVKEWPKEQYGTFFTGDSYLILRTEYTPQPVSYIFTWVGGKSTPDEVKGVAAKAAELEQAVGGDASTSTQPQGKETSQFLSYFPNNALIYLDGGIDTAWREDIKAPTIRLLQIKGKKNVRVSQAPLNPKGLNSGDCFILDAGLHIFQWNGKGCNPAERRKATDILRGLVNERTGKPITHNLDEGDTDAEFWGYLGGIGQVSTAAEGGDDDEVASVNHQHKLYKLSDNHGHGKLQLDLVATAANNNQRLLDPKDVFIFDAGVEIFVWVGKQTSAEEKKHAVGWANQYAQEHQRAVPITRLIQGGESYYFKQAFSF